MLFNIFRKNAINMGQLIYKPVVFSIIKKCNNCTWKKIKLILIYIYDYYMNSHYKQIKLDI